MFFPGLSKTIPSVPAELRESVVMAVRIIEGQKGKKVDLVGTKQRKDGCADIKYRTVDFTDHCEVKRQEEEIQSWANANPENLKKGLIFLKDTLEPMVKLAQKMGMGPKVG